jgi:hypothetical protein
MQHTRFFFHGLLLLVCVASTTAALAQNNNFVEPPPWAEVMQAPPAAFNLDKLIPVANPTRSNLSYSVAPDTVSVGSDKVVRYVIVAKSPRGAMNVLYEGVRCDTREVKAYASWRLDSGWRELSDAQWQELRNANSRYAQTMSDDAFCDVRIVYGSAEDIVQRLRKASKPY